MFWTMNVLNPEFSLCFSPGRVGLASEQANWPHLEKLEFYQSLQHIVVWFSTQVMVSYDSANNRFIFRKLSIFSPISEHSCLFRKSMSWDHIRIKSLCVYSRQWRLSNLIPPEVKVHRHSSHCPNDGTITKQFFALQFYSDNSKFIFLASGQNFCAFRVRATQRALKSMHVISATTMWHSVEFC